MPVLYSFLSPFLVLLTLLLLYLIRLAFCLPGFPGLGLQQGQARLYGQKEKKNPQEQFNYLCPVHTHAMSRLFNISKLGLFFGILIISSILAGCVKDNRDEVPYVYLNLMLGLSTDLAHLGVMETATIIPDENGFGVIRFSHPEYPEILLGLGQIINGNGLIIYRWDIYEYEVYDITCTFQAQTDYCALHRNADFEGVFDCSCCSSRFLYNSDGYYAIEGPAAMPLRRYNAFIQADALIIRN